MKSIKDLDRNTLKQKIKEDFENKVIRMFAVDINEATLDQKYLALGELIKEYTFERWMKTNKKYIKDEVKQVYYFSIEFLLGRLLVNNLINLGIRDVCKEALQELNISLEEIEEAEKEPGLGNGGLGRLAACFLDSMAALGYPGHGNGIRYSYGLFEQKLVNGYQVEVPDNWLSKEYVWEVKRSDRAITVRYGGNVRFEVIDGKLKAIHENYESVLAVPYDIPVIGFNCNTVNTLRLWSAEPVERDFDFTSFSSGDYIKAVEYKYLVQSISQVLYPDDTNEQNRILRLKQEYFFVSAGVQSIIRTFKKKGKPIYDLPKFVVIQINDTHPSLVIPEMMRILIDDEGLSWEIAWEITTNTIAYTNHTIMVEALEKWPIDLLKSLLPRIYTIIEEINRRFCSWVLEKYNGDWNKACKMAIIQDGYVNMAHLSVIGSKSVNGVAKIHTEILQTQIFKDFYDIYPYKFNNKTNGITHRRWLIEANTPLADLLVEVLNGYDWVKNPIKMRKFKDFEDDLYIQDRVANIKFNNKVMLSNYIKRKYNIDVDPNSIFDIQAKRLHAYKRQLLNALHIMYLYNVFKENPNFDFYPRTFIFAAKAAPGYFLAKKIIKLINTIADKVNKDPDVNNKLKVVFLENYNVSLAEKIIPCADVSEQISTASKEASGTGNMKFMMNGAITIGTLDGANIEILEAVGQENIVIFGLRAEEVIDYYKNGGYSSFELYQKDQRLKKIIDQLIGNFFDVPKDEFIEIYHHLITYNDEYFVLKDFDSYHQAHLLIDNFYKDQRKWRKMMINNIAASGVFSSDNTINKYANDIWKIKKIVIPN
ncbi:glycogen/starch/alpha-glucan phosphorylase [Caldicellulosiruptoraceae bacterium PP1]